jgi:hypothetical protein
MLGLSSDTVEIARMASRYRGTAWGIASVGRSMLPYKKPIFVEPQK